MAVSIAGATNLSDVFCGAVLRAAQERGVPLTEITVDGHWGFAQEPVEEHIVYRQIVGIATQRFYQTMFRLRYADGRRGFVVLDPVVVENGRNDYREDLDAMGRKLLDALNPSPPAPRQE